MTKKKEGTTGNENIFVGLYNREQTHREDGFLLSTIIVIETMSLHRSLLLQSS